MKHALQQIDQVAPTPATVLLLGETGAGKEILAEALHDRSPRRQRPMVRVNCAAIPATLIESELFGHERGAFTGAIARRIGRFEVADGSTLFLDEIGELPLDVQVKLLRVLHDRVVERLGSAQSIKVNVRIIAATNRNLDAAVQEKVFREDLFYRLNVFPITVPPLRDRAEDILGSSTPSWRNSRRRWASTCGPSPPNRCRSSAVCLAGQRPRASQRHRARRNRGPRDRC
jgi:transcriptional regulator with GAF, ATPase, and Fis domain